MKNHQNRKHKSEVSSRIITLAFMIIHDHLKNMNASSVDVVFSDGELRVEFIDNGYGVYQNCPVR